MTIPLSGAATAPPLDFQDAGAGSSPDAAPGVQRCLPAPLSASSAPRGSARAAPRPELPRDHVMVRMARSTVGLTASSSARRARASTSRTSGSHARSSSSGTASSSKPRGEFAFLDDKTLSIEDKLMRFFALMTKKMDEDVVKKMKAIESGRGSGGSSSTSSASGTGGSGEAKKSSFGLFDALKLVVPAVGLGEQLLGQPVIGELLKQATGPVLAAGATALGMPQLAPALLSAGPQLASAVAGAARSMEGALQSGSSSSTGKSGTSKAGGSSGASGTSSDQQLQMMELQRLMEKQKEMMSAISNTLRALHDMRMNTIQNIR